MRDEKVIIKHREMMMEDLHSEGEEGIKEPRLRLRNRISNIIRFTLRRLQARNWLSTHDIIRSRREEEEEEKANI